MAHRWSEFASREVEDLLQALEDALALIDAARLPYLHASLLTRRLIIQSLYERLILEAGEEATAERTLLYAQLTPATRELAGTVPQRPGAVESPASRPETTSPAPHDDHDPDFSGPRFVLQSDGGD